MSHPHRPPSRAREYRGHPPVWRWSLAPGITALQQTEEPYTCANAQITDAAQRPAFVGGATDGWSGVAAQDLRRTDAGSTLLARKAWFFSDAGVVALGAGIASSDGRFSAVTSVEQRPLDTSAGAVGGAWVGMSPAGSPPQLLPAGELLEGVNVSWVWHAGVLYALSLPGSSIPGVNASTAVPAVSTRNQTGSWAAITQGPNATITTPTFLAYLHHGNVGVGARSAGEGGGAPAAAGYAYAIIPGPASPQAAAAAYAALLNSTAVLQNSASTQAVCFGAPNSSTAWTLQVVAWPAQAGVGAAGTSSAATTPGAGLPPTRHLVRSGEEAGAPCPAAEVLSGPGLVQASLAVDGALTVTFADPTAAAIPRNASVVLAGLRASGPCCTFNGSHTVVSAPLPVQPGYAGSSVTAICQIIAWDSVRL